MKSIKDQLASKPIFNFKNTEKIKQFTPMNWCNPFYMEMIITGFIIFAVIGAVAFDIYIGR